MKTIRTICAYLIPLLIILALPPYVEEMNLPFDKSVKYIIGIIISIIISLIVGYLIEPSNKRRLLKLLSVILSLIGMFTVYGLAPNQTILIISIISIVAITLIMFLILTNIVDHKEIKNK